MGDKETVLDNLNTDLSKEEEDIVDSIINELNDEEPQEQGPQPNKMPPQHRQPQQMPPNQMPPQHRQQPQQMPPGMMPPNQMPPGMMPPNQMPPGMMPPGMMPPPENKKETSSILDKLKMDLRDPLIVAIISLVFMLPQSNNLISGLNIGFFLNADKSINIYGLFIKALLVGIIYFLVKKYV